MRVLVLLALVGAALAVPKRVSRIEGGELTTVDQYPYISNMLYHWFGSLWTQWCSGSLITTTTVLSAAYCYKGDSPSQWTVRVGTSFAFSEGQLIPVSQLVLHEQYNHFTEDNNVAIIRLASAAVLNANVGVARIPGPGYILPDGTKVASVGWGEMSVSGGRPEQLQHVILDIINHELCAERYAFLKTQPGFQAWPDVTEELLCAGILDEGGKDACHPGGPLAHDRDVIVGITSWGYGCAHHFYPGVNTRVSAYTDWIVANSS